MIRFNDRTLVLGYTQSGKSELLNHHLSTMRCQRLLVDTKDEWAIAGVEPVRSAEVIDWRAPVIHYVGDTGELAELDRVFAGAYEHRPLVVCVHELSDLCDYSPNRTPPNVSKYLSKGASHGLGLLGASQRPVEMPKRARTEAAHVFAFVPRMDADDNDIVARMMQMPRSELEQLLDAHHAEDGDHAFLWFDRRARRLSRWAPLPERVRAQSVVKRRVEL